MRSPPVRWVDRRRGAGPRACSAVASVTAQSDPRLVDAVRAAQEGRGDSARTIVDRLLAATPPSDTLYPQILYTQAMVAGTAGDMRRLLQRVTVEYGTSSWADDALLRLVQMDYATRNFDGAARNLERLKLDFPATPLLPQAAYWAGRTYFDANNPAAACRWLADGMAQARNDVEAAEPARLSLPAMRPPRRHGRAGSGDGHSPRRLDRASTAGAQAAAAPPPGAPSPGAPSPAAPSPATPSPSAAPIGAAPTPAPVPIQPPSAANAPPAAAPTPVSPPAAGPAARTIYRVQIAAVATRKGAEDAARKARPLGLTRGHGRREGPLQGAAGRVPHARGRPERRGEPQGPARRQSVRRRGALTDAHVFAPAPADLPAGAARGAARGRRPGGRRRGDELYRWRRPPVPACHGARAAALRLRDRRRQRGTVSRDHRRLRRHRRRPSRAAGHVARGTAAARLRGTSVARPRGVVGP